VPFTGDSAVAIAMKHVQEAPVPPRQLVPAIPPELEAVVLRAMAKDPSRRYHSADEMGMDLDRVRKGLGLTAATAALAATDAYASQTMVATPPPPGAYAVAPAAAPPRRTWPWVVVLILHGAVAALAAYLLFNLNDSTSNDTATTGTTATTVALVPVPNVIGFPTGGAITTLQNAGFTVVQQHKFSSKPKDTVIKTDPVANTQVAPKSSVTIVISDGIEQVTVEDVVGKQFAAAQAILQGDGFDVVQKGKSSDTVPEGEVIAQDPQGGTAVDKGTTVTIVISDGPPPVTVPDVTGQTDTDATNALQDQGFNVQTQTVPVTDPTQDGIVQSTNPPAGKKVPNGSTVTITVGKLGP
jgi:serine/threonine-protein kinase